MATTFSNLKQELADRLGEDSSSYPDNLVYYSDTELGNYINKAYNDFMKKTKIYVETKTDVSADANGYYTLAVDINKVMSIYYEGKELKIAMTKEIADKVGKNWRAVDCEEGALPEYATWENNYTTRSSQEIAFTVIPIPSTYKDVEISYIPYIELSNDADTMITPDGAEDTILLYAESLAYRKDGIVFDLQFSEIRKQQYFEDIQNYIFEYYTKKKILPMGNRLQNRGSDNQ